MWTGDDERQLLAVGLVDGAIIILDLVLGVEKFFLEKHPAAITTMSFFEDKYLMSGSIDGRVNIVELDSKEQSKLSKCQNC